MANSIPPVPHKTPMLDAGGLPTAPWAAWFRQLFSVVGGSTGATAESVATDLAAHIGDSTAAHAASAISNTPAGSLSSTNVQSALYELQGDIDTLIANPGPQGQSAYEVAVTNGFIGTATAWLLSLVGATGPTGLTGPQGAAGIQGPEGPPGGSVNTQFATSSLDGSIYSNSSNGHVYLLEFGT